MIQPSDPGGEHGFCWTLLHSDTESNMISCCPSVRYLADSPREHFSCTARWKEYSIHLGYINDQFPEWISIVATSLHRPASFKSLHSTSVHLVMASSVLGVSQPIAHKTRQYQSHPGSHYVLPSDEPERERFLFITAYQRRHGMSHNTAFRLNLQHRLLTTIFDNRLIFAPLPSIRGDEAFLDSGTGSGK